MRVRWLALWCALASVARVSTYTVDCNHEYTDCDNELSKLTSEDEDQPTALPMIQETSTEHYTTLTPHRTTKLPNEPKISEVTTQALPETTPKSQVKSGIEELQQFANALHNQSQAVESKAFIQGRGKSLSDLSDIELDDEEEKDDKRLDKFYSKLVPPFSPLLPTDRSDEVDMACRENGVAYKIGDKIDRGCEETCECVPGGILECGPRCKHPFIRRGRRLNDPLCFESPVDECCSIIACATGNNEKGHSSVAVAPLCHHGNETYTVGTKWNLGCERICECELNSIVSCKPRCPELPPSDKCINVQDPNDACCEVQVCDVSQDVHEEPENMTSSTSTTTTITPTITSIITSTTPSVITTDRKEFTFPGEISRRPLEPILPDDVSTPEITKTTMRPLVLIEPIGSINVLQNNSVRVNLMKPNDTRDPIHLMLSSDGGKTFEDVELKYSNLILNLAGGKDYVLKTKETGTKFNFTITATDMNNNEVPEDKTEKGSVGKVGCHHDGKFYAVGEEFHIGCSELCECTGQETHECANLECPNHVGLELVSRGCVHWAPSPTPHPPNCCPRSARCLSDGTCTFKGHSIPNWSEVPITLTGCEQRCFCENGELDCQEVCSPLPPIPPQTLRCPPMFRPAPVNISDEDCCKQWGCLPNAITKKKQTPYSLPDEKYSNHATPIPSERPIYRYVLPIPKLTTEPTNTYESPYNNIHKYKNPFKFIPERWRHTEPKLDSLPFHDYKIWGHGSAPQPSPAKDKQLGINIFTPEDTNSPIVLHPEPPLSSLIDNATDTFFEEPETFFKPIQPNPILPTFRIHPKSNVQLRLYDKIHGFKNIMLRPEDSDVRIDTKREHLWINDKNHHYARVPSSFETILLKVPENKLATQAFVQKRGHLKSKSQTKMDIENIMKHLEMSSEVSRVLERSASRSAENTTRPTRAGATPMPGFPPIKNHPQPSFLPTLPPEIHRYPQEEEIPDYDQNNIHRPETPSETPINPIIPILPPPPKYGEDNKKLAVISLQADSPTSVKMLFGLPPVLVGLRGSVDLRYTDKADEDVSRWYSQVFAPADEILSTSRLEFRLNGLKPSTLYRVRGKLYLHNLPVEPESDIYTVKTLDLPSMEEKRREIDSRLTVMDVNDTVAHVTWRHFTEDELLLIDGIQVRYRPVGTPIYIMTELLHHSRVNAELLDLRPGSKYEASLVLVPPPRAVTELHDPTSVEFTTQPYVDPYNWSVTVEALSVGSEAAELTWRGIPAPAERWVRVYRAAHECGSGRTREHDAFRLAERDQPPAITISGLEPETRCRVWLELFLTNGKVKTSNVLEVMTKSQDVPEPIDNAIEASSVGGRGGANRGDYYGALVVVGVIAALGAVTSLLLLLIVVRRHRPRSCPITPVPTAPRESSLPPYDNPAYKLELQQETMDL